MPVFVEGLAPSVRAGRPLVKGRREGCKHSSDNFVLPVTIPHKQMFQLPSSVYKVLENWSQLKYYNTGKRGGNLKKCRCEKAGCKCRQEKQELIHKRLFNRLVLGMMEALFSGS